MPVSHRCKLTPTDAWVAKTWVLTDHVRIADADRQNVLDDMGIAVSDIECIYRLLEITQESLLDSYSTGTAFCGQQHATSLARAPGAKRKVIVSIRIFGVDIIHMGCLYIFSGGIWSYEMPYVLPTRTYCCFQWLHMCNAFLQHPSTIHVVLFRVPHKASHCISC